MVSGTIQGRRRGLVSLSRWKCFNSGTQNCASQTIGKERLMNWRKLLSYLIVFTCIISPIASNGQTVKKCEPNNDRALVLSGGGAKGAFEAGAIFHFINHRDCDFRDVAGVSVGALNATYISEAPSDGNSLRNLQERSQGLVDFWRSINRPDDILRPRFLGSLRLLLGLVDSLYDFTPLQRIIEREVHPKKIRESRRSLRVGVVSFHDGVYQEFDPNDVQDDRVFRRYVLASTAIPVNAPLPRIPSSTTNSEIQYADGGVSHATPVVAYFSPCDFSRSDFSQKTLFGGRQFGLLPPCVAIGLQEHRGPIKELFVVVANPYDPALTSSETGTVMSGGLEILERTIDVLFTSSYRWDLNFALAANRMLKWREDTYAWAKSIGAEGKAREVLGITEETDLSRVEFPVKSANPGPDGFPLAYKMGVVAPLKVYADSYGFDKANIRLQLYKGCIHADLMMAQKFGMGSMRDACKRDFMKDVDEQQLKDDPDPPL